METSPRPWLARYPAGQPHEIDLAECPTLEDLLGRTFRRFAALPAFTSLGGTLTWREVDVASRDFASGLQHRLGLARGERLAIMLPNLLQHPVSTFGALRAGLVVVNVNPLYTARELAFQLQDAGARAIVVLENFAHVLQQALREHPMPELKVIVTAAGDMLPAVREFVTNIVVRHVRQQVPGWELPGAHAFKDVLHDGARRILDERPAQPQDLAFLQYTGGTTGVAKGVMLTHRNLAANVLQLGSWIARDLRDGEEVAMMPLPLYHVYALTCNLVFTRIGAHVLLVTNPRDSAELTGTLRHHRVSVLVGVNTLYRAMLDAPDLEAVDFSHLKVCAAGGMAVQRTVAERWKRRAGVPLVEGYGLTEASPVVTSNPLDIREWNGSIGLPLPSTEVAVLGEDGHCLATGAVGEIAVRGPQVMAGYWQRPEETERVTAPGGWLRTGDLGYMDPSGSFHLTDRKKDVIVVSGFKVFPSEVEEVVSLHPGVQEVAAVGVPDRASGEAVRLVVVRRDPDLTAQALVEHCRRYLTGYKVPRRIEFSQEPLPRSPIGKVLRRALREGVGKEPLADAKAAGPAAASSAAPSLASSPVACLAPSPATSSMPSATTAAPASAPAPALASATEPGTGADRLR